MAARHGAKSKVPFVAYGIWRSGAETAVAVMTDSLLVVWRDMTCGRRGDISITMTVMRDMYSDVLQQYCEYSMA